MGAYPGHYSNIIFYFGTRALLLSITIIVFSRVNQLQINYKSNDVLGSTLKCEQKVFTKSFYEHAE